MFCYFQEAQTTFSKSVTEQCLDAVYAIQSDVKSSAFGANQEAVTSSLAVARSRTKDIETLQNKLQKRMQDVTTNTYASPVNAVVMY